MGPKLTDVFNRMVYKLVTLDGSARASEVSCFKMKARFSLFDLAFIWGLVIPITLVHLALKSIRIEKFASLGGFIGLVDIFKSDIFLHLAFALLGLALLGFMQKLAYRLILFFLLQIGAAIFTALEIGAHNFYMITGSTLDFNLLALTVEKFQELKGVLKSESSHGNGMLILSLSVAACLLLPWVVAGCIHTFRKIRAREFLRDIYMMPVLFHRRLIFFVLAVLSYLALALPSFKGGNNLFAQNFVLTIVGSYFDSVEANDKSVATFSAPVNTYLEKKPYAKTKNLVFIILESTRVRSTSIFDEKIGTTPFLRQMAQKSILVEKASTIIPRTSKSLVSIHCSVEPRPTMRILEVEANGIPSRCLPALLNEHDYETAYFQSATEKFENRRQMVGNFGFKEFYPGEVHNKAGMEKTNYFGYEDRMLLKSSLSWHRHRIKHKKKRPFMVTYLTNTTHHLYGLPSWFKIKKYHDNYIVNKYMNTIRYVDDFVRDLIAQYKKLKIYEDTIFVFVADHGEGLWEHGHFGHSNTIYDEGLQIPLMVHDPRRFTRGVRIKRRANQTDILPTVADLMGFEIRGGSYRGFNLLNSNISRTVRAACWHENRCISSYRGDYKFIHNFGKSPDEVYNLVTDPSEKTNVSHTISAHDLAIWRQQDVEWYKNVESFYQAHRDSAAQLARSGETASPL